MIKVYEKNWWCGGEKRRRKNKLEYVRWNIFNNSIAKVTVKESGWKLEKKTNGGVSRIRRKPISKTAEYVEKQDRAKRRAGKALEKS